jgi:hypothetical protein
MRIFAAAAVLTVLGATAACSTEAEMKAVDPSGSDGSAAAAPSDGAPTPVPDGEVRTQGLVMVLDDGDGPELCLGGVAESYPPQCGGPIVDGLQMGDWAETVDGVSFGERTVDVSWPPVDDHVTLLAERDYEPVGVPQPPASAPGEFSATELRTAADAIGAAMLRGDLDIGGFYQDDTSRRVVVEVVAADKATVRALADLVDDPSILVVIGFDEIVEGP